MGIQSVKGLPTHLHIANSLQISIHTCTAKNLPDSSQPAMKGSPESHIKMTVSGVQQGWKLGHPTSVPSPSWTFSPSELP